jgi:hypothetical protein
MEIVGTIKSIGKDAEIFGNAIDNDEIARIGFGLRRASSDVLDRKMGGDAPYLISMLIKDTSKLNSTVARTAVDRTMQPEKGKLLRKIAVGLEKLDTMHRDAMKARQMRARTRRRINEMGDKMIKRCIDIGGAKAW